MHDIKANFERIRRTIEDGERRIAQQEALIERLRAKGRPTGEAQEVLFRMRELRKTHLRLREQFERLVAELNRTPLPPSRLSPRR